MFFFVVVILCFMMMIKFWRVNKLVIGLSENRVCRKYECNKNLKKMVIVILIVFLICWMFNVVIIFL